jgi:hypothetical protein
MRTLSLCVLALLCGATARAQENQTPPKCSLSGSVEDSVSQQPLDAFTVILSPGQKSATTDAKGNFQFKDVDPGTYHLDAFAAEMGASNRKVVSLTCGQDLSGVRLKADLMGSIVGRVLDENGEPVVNAQVDLVSRDYFVGKLRYIISSVATTNDKGEYSLSRVRPGYKYFVYASLRERRLDAISKVPANPKLRKKVLEPEYYGGSDRPEGAQVVMVRPGERKEGVDFKLRRTAAWCIDGVIRIGADQGRSLFSIGESQPHSGFSPSADGGFFKSPPSGQTGEDGKFRVCNLHPGEYTITTTVFDSEHFATVFSKTEASITDGDLHDLKISALPKIPISGEVVWDGPAPQQPVDGRIHLFIQPIGRPGFLGEHEAFNADSHIPGQFSFPGLFLDQYHIRIWGVPKDSYLKEATYSGTSVLSAPIVPGSVGNSSMRIVLARDGGTIQVKVVDKDKNALPDTTFVILPADIGSPALLADSMIRTSTDQNGTYTSDRLAPGKYIVIATDSVIDYSADCIDKLWALRNKMDAVELAPNGSLSLTLELTSIN